MFWVVWLLVFSQVVLFYVVWRLAKKVAMLLRVTDVLVDTQTTVASLLSDVFKFVSGK